MSGGGWGRVESWPKKGGARLERTTGASRAGL